MQRISSVGVGGSLAAGLALFLMANPAAAQTPEPAWQVRTEDNGSLVMGSAYLPDHSLSFDCNAPSSQGLPLFQTGSHETHLTDPFHVMIAPRDDLFEWSPPYWQRGVVLNIDGSRHMLRDFQLNELSGSAVPVAMDAAIVRALDTASTLALITPEGLEHRFPVTGLSDALHTALGVCIDRWAEMGHAIPPGVNPVAPADAQADVGAGPLPGIPVFDLSGTRSAERPRREPLPGIPVFDLSGNPGTVAAAPPARTVAALPQPIQQALGVLCDGQARIEDSVISTAADFDGDGALDYVINHSGVYCLPENRREYCGAANCSIDVFLSSRGLSHPAEFLAIDLLLETAPSGRPGLRISATPFMCGGGVCDAVLVWNGEEFAPE